MIPVRAPSLTAAICIALCGNFIQAADPSPADAAAVDEIPYAPRKLKFRELDEKIPLVVKRLNSKLLEQQYVVTVRLDGILPVEDMAGNAASAATPEGVKAMIGATPEKMRPSKEVLELLQESVLSTSLYALNESPGGADRGPRAERMDLVHLRHSMSPDKALVERVRSIEWYQEVGGSSFGGWGGSGGRRARPQLTRSIDPDGVIMAESRRREPRRRIEGQGFARCTHEFQFLAPSAAQARGLAEAFLVLLDQGHALPARKLMAKRKQVVADNLAKREVELEDARKKLDEAVMAWEAVQGNESLSAEGRTELQKKQLLLRVEQVGVTARITVLEKKIADAEKRRPGSAPDNIVALKDAAEVEVAGLTGQLNEIDRLLKATSARQKAQNSLTSWRQKVSTIEGELNLDKIERAVYEEDFLATAPFVLKDESIPVQPIAWTPDN